VSHVAVIKVPLMMTPQLHKQRNIRPRHCCHVGKSFELPLLQVANKNAISLFMRH